MSYPAGCFNLGKMLMTGKGGIAVDRFEGYSLLDRACKGGHGGACFLQAQMLCTRPGSLDPRIPHDPRKATKLYQKTCDDGDSLRYETQRDYFPPSFAFCLTFCYSCFTLATMLLRGDRVNKTADNVSPQEARGMVPLAKRENEVDRARDGSNDNPYVIPRDPSRAEKLLRQACDTGGHLTSCHNLAVMYSQGDDGVPVDLEMAEKYKKITSEKINVFGGF